MLKVGIVGATGFSGEELIAILLEHPYAKITHVSAEIDRPALITKIFPRFKNKISLVCAQPKIKEITGACDLIFLALPHRVSMGFAPQLLRAGKKVIDLSADYRFSDSKIYEKFYQTEHKDKRHLTDAVYGLPELYRNKIKKARLIANPGCYPTAAILALAPALALTSIDLGSIIIDAKSGISGAGRNAVEEFLASDIKEDFKAYKVNSHQHAPEISQELSKLAGKKTLVTFVPHLLPVKRGILETIYLKKASGYRQQAAGLVGLYRKFYKKEPFVRIKEEGQFPRLKEVVGTNFCDIGIKEEADKTIIIAAIDNLLKGASGQAVQNMNIMYGFPEQAGLR